MISVLFPPKTGGKSAEHDLTTEFCFQNSKLFKKYISLSSGQRNIGKISEF